MPKTVKFFPVSLKSQKLLFVWLQQFLQLNNTNNNNAANVLPEVGAVNIATSRPVITTTPSGLFVKATNMRTHRSGGASKGIYRVQSMPGHNSVSVSIAYPFYFPLDILLSIALILHSMSMSLNHTYVILQQFMQTTNDAQQPIRPVQNKVKEPPSYEKVLQLQARKEGSPASVAQQGMKFCHIFDYGR